MKDPVQLKYFEDLRASKIMSSDDTKSAFHSMDTINNDLVVSLHTSTAFWKLLYRQWAKLTKDNKVSSKLSVNHCGTRAKNKALSIDIDKVFVNLPAQSFQPPFCSVASLIDVKIRRPVYFKLYSTLLKNNELSEDQVVLFRKLEQVRTSIINSNLRLVVSFASPYRDKGIDFSDLIQEGNLGLMRAIDKYSPDNGTKFSTYAHWWIRQAFVRVIKAQGRIHIPAHIQDSHLRMKLKGGFIEETTNELDKETYERLLGMTSVPIPLDAKINGFRDYNDGDEGLSGVLYDEEQKMPDDEVGKLQLEAALLKEISRLDTNSQTIVILRHGLMGHHCHTFQEIADKMKTITREWARQLDVQAMQKLKGPTLERFVND